MRSQQFKTLQISINQIYMNTVEIRTIHNMIISMMNK